MSISTATDNSHNTPVPCECQKYSIEIWKGEVPEGADPGEFVDYIETGCVQTTTRTFAPGHDAKLKSLMIRAGIEGNAIRRDEGGVAHIGDAVDMAGAFGFEVQVRAGIQRLAAKKAAKAQKAMAAQTSKEIAKRAASAASAAKKAAKAQAKADKPAKAPKAARESKPLVTPVTIKVGRWTYEAIINPADNSAEFTSGSGKVKTVEEGKYALVTV